MGNGYFVSFQRQTASHVIILTNKVWGHICRWENTIVWTIQDNKCVWEKGGKQFHHGGPFRKAVLDGVLDPERVIQIGIRGGAEYLWEFSYESGMTVIHAEEVPKMGIEAIIAKARSVVGDGPVYVSFDVDSLDPAFAPGTGTPEVGGLTTRETLEIIRGLAGLDIVGADVVEVAPQYDATSNTAQAGAQTLFTLLSLVDIAIEKRRSA